MNYKEKYEEAFKKAKDLHDNHALGMPFIYETCEQIFPELRESEDKRIRKSIIGFLITISSLKDGKTVSNKDFDPKAILEWATWLEKQTIDISSFPEEQRKYMEKYVNLDKTTLVKLLAERDENVSEILDCENNEIKKIEQKASIDFLDLKTWKYIVDAVLTKEHGVGQYLDDGRTEIMAKELQERFGNISQNPAWGEEDERMSHEIQFLISSYRTGDNEHKLCSWIDNLKDRVQPQPRQDWSKEDELNFNQAIYVCHQHGYSGVENWLKFFKKRIKGEKS